MNNIICEKLVKITNFFLKQSPVMKKSYMYLKTAKGLNQPELIQPKITLPVF